MKGPEVEFVYPPNVPYSREDISAISFNSFPERHETESDRDTFFHYTIRNQSPDITLRSPQSPHGSSTELYCNCIFRQQQDKELKRGFDQKSLVLVSHHQFTAFFSELVKVIAASDVLSDPDRLEAACHEIASWKPPKTGNQELPFLGNLLSINIAPHPAFPLQGLKSPYNEEKHRFNGNSIDVHAPVGDWFTISPHLTALNDLYAAFEHLFLGGSIVILARNPQECSSAVSAFVDLVKPVPYGGTIRPYLTMQSDFFAGAQDSNVPRNFVIGITNPFLLQRVLTVMETHKYDAPRVIQLKESPEETPPLKLHRSLRRSKRQSQSIDVPGGLEIVSSPKKYLKSDHDFLGQLEAILQDSATTPTMVDGLVRRHFSNLAAQFLSPINRYLATHVQTTNTLGNEHTENHTQYTNFNTKEFIKSLSKYGTGIDWRGTGPLQKHKARDSFYKAFCEGPNFFAWMEMKILLESEARAGLLGGS